MQKKYIYACLLAALALFTYSCKKDLGNYKYTDINTAKFGSELNGTITAYVLTQLTIRPTITFSKDSTVTDSSRYSYQWAYVSGSALKTLAQTKNLNMLVSLNPGKYTTVYTVTDKTTGVIFRKQFVLNILSKLNEGWMLMTEVNGNARLDMLNKQIDGSFLPVIDVFGQANGGLQLKGNAKLVYSYNCGALKGYGINLPYAIYLGTDQSTNRVNNETFAWLPAYNVTKEILDNNLPADFHIDAIKRINGLGNTLGGCNSYMISSAGDVYFSSYAPATKYAQPLNFDAVTGHPYKVAPFIGGSENSTTPTNSVYFYDMTNRRFRMHLSTNDAKLLAVPDPSGSQPFLFPFNNTGKDLVYMTVAKTNQVYAILKDPATSKYYLAIFQANDGKQLYYKEIVATDFDKAENYAVSNLTGYLFYNVGSKLYIYDISPTTPLCTMIKDYGTVKISTLKFQIYHSTTPPLAETDKLLVCSYDPALPEGQNGKLEKFVIQNNGASLALDQVFTGFGKVVSLHYRER